MTEQPPDPAGPHAGREDLNAGAQPEIEAEPGSAMPRWVPVLIGLVLVSIASIAVYTGLRYRDDNTMAEHVRPRTERDTAPAPAGEPGAGEPLVMHGSGDADNAPAANEPVQGQARAVVTGGPGGVQSTIRMWARRGMVLNVLPDDAMVYVNDLLIGQVRQFNTMDEVYDFAQPGSYTIRIVAPGGTEKTFVVTAAEDAKQEVARISARM